MINRAVVILHVKEPFVRWLNEADPVKGATAVTLEDANDDNTAYLITEDDAEALDDWLALNYEALFESALEDWFADEALWPRDRTRQLFDQWFDVSLHTVVLDTVGETIVDDEA